MTLLLAAIIPIININAICFANIAKTAYVVFG